MLIATAAGLPLGPQVYCRFGFKVLEHVIQANADPVRQRAQGGAGLVNDRLDE